jgi:hypothetical protein
MSVAGCARRSVNGRFQVDDALQSAENDDLISSIDEEVRALYEPGVPTFQTSLTWMNACRSSALHDATGGNLADIAIALRSYNRRSFETFTPFMTFGFVALPLLLVAAVVVLAVRVITDWQSLTLSDGWTRIALGLFVTFVIAASASIVLFWRWRVKLSPLSVLKRLLDALDAAENPENGWTDVRTRTEVISRLGSLRIELLDIPKVLRTGDRTVDFKVNERFEHKAAYVRGLCQRVALPMHQTQSDITTALAGMAVHAALAEWGELPEAEPDNSVAGKLGRIAGWLARLFVIALGPLTAWFVTASPLTSDAIEEFAGLVWVGGFLWSIVGLALLVSRDFTVDLLGALKEARGSLGIEKVR